MIDMRTICVLMAALALPTFSQAAEIKLLASAALKPAYVELIPEFEKATGHKVAVTWSGSPEIQKRVAGGEFADVVILSSSGTNELVKQDKLVGDSHSNFAKSGIGVAVRAGAPKPDISSGEAVKKAILAAKSIAYSAGASGVYIVSMFEKLGVAEQVKAKVANRKPGEPVGDVVARGDAELGFHQVSELLPVRGIDYLGPLPPEIQNITVFAGGMHTASKDTAAAKALIHFLTLPSAKPTLQKHGLEPG